MPDELYFQKKLREAASDLHPDGYGFKQSNQFLGGVPDLLLQIPPYPTTMLEVKQIELKPSLGTITIGPTELQRQKILKHQSAGGRAGWILVAHARNGEKWVYVSIDPTRISMKLEQYKDVSCRMSRSDPWAKALMLAMEAVNAHPWCYTPKP